MRLLALTRGFALHHEQVGIRANFDGNAHAFVATATQPIKEGTELMFYYGSMCKDSFVNLYGFAPANARPCRDKTVKTMIEHAKKMGSPASRFARAHPEAFGTKGAIAARTRRLPAAKAKGTG